MSLPCSCPLVAPVLFLLLFLYCPCLFITSVPSLPHIPSMSPSPHCPLFLPCHCPCTAHVLSLSLSPNCPCPCIAPVSPIPVLLRCPCPFIDPAPSLPLPLHFPYSIIASVPPLPLSTASALHCPCPFIAPVPPLLLSPCCPCSFVAPVPPLPLSPAPAPSQRAQSCMFVFRVPPYSQDDKRADISALGCVQWRGRSRGWSEGEGGVKEESWGYVGGPKER